MLSIVGWRYNSVVQHVFCMHEALDSILSTKKEKKKNKEERKNAFCKSPHQWTS